MQNVFKLYAKMWNLYFLPEEESWMRVGLFFFFSLLFFFFFFRSDPVNPVVIEY